MPLPIRRRRAAATAATLDCNSEPEYPFFIDLYANGAAAVVVAAVVGPRLAAVPSSPQFHLGDVLDELELLVTESHEVGLLADHEQELVINILDFAQERVEQVMTPLPMKISRKMNLNST